MNKIYRDIYNAQNGIYTMAITMFTNLHPIKPTKCDHVKIFCAINKWKQEAHTV